MDWHYHALLNALLQAQSVDELVAGRPATP